MQRAAIYARLPEKGEHDLEQCLNIIKEGKSSLTNVYVDFGQGGFDFERPEFRKLELCVRERLVDMVVIPSLMQFCRDISKALAKIREFKSHGIAVYFCDLSVKDMADDEQEAFNALLDETLGIHPSKTYGVGDSVEDEISSDIEHMEGYIDDFQIVDEAFLDEEVENDD